VGGGQRVFVARLANVAVFDPNGDQVGKVRDVVARMRTSGQPPRVIGAVVEIQHHRQIFVPMGRVRHIDADGVVVTGTLSLKRFQRRADEVTAVGELLDRQVRLPGREGTFAVVDVAMEPTRTAEWLITRLAVAEVRRGPFRRRGPVTQVAWQEVRGLLSRPEEEQGAASLLAVYEDLVPADVAQAMHELPESRRQQVAEALDDDRLADVMEELPEGEQIRIIERLAIERAADVLEAMDPDAAADLLGDLPTQRRERLLARMEPEEADPVRRLLQYDSSTAGGLMTSEPIVVGPDATVAEALALLRNPDLTPALATQVYVCRPPTVTPTGRYLGTAHFQKLLREPPGSLVSGGVEIDVDPIRPGATLTQVTAHFATYNLVAAPVVDQHHRLLGAVTVDDVLDHLLPENWRENQGY